MRIILFLILVILLIGTAKAEDVNNTSNVTKIANAIVNKSVNATQNAINATSKLLERLKKKEMIEWEIIDKTDHTEFYVPKTSENFSISIITKRENSKVALAYSDYVRFLYDTMYITAINKNNTTLVFRFVTNTNAKTLEFKDNVILLKVKFDDDVKKLSFSVEEKETKKELFNFTNITILHKTYERHITETTSTIRVEKWAYYGSKALYFVGGVAEAFIVCLVVLYWLKKRKEDTILVGW